MFGNSISPQKTFLIRSYFWWGWCANCRNLREKGTIRTTPSFALAMLIVDFVGVVRGFRGLKFNTTSRRVLFRTHTQTHMNWHVSRTAHLQPGFSAGLGLFGAGFAVFLHFSSFKCRGFSSLNLVPVMHLLSPNFALFKCRVLPFWRKRETLKLSGNPSPSCPLKHANT